MPFDDDVADREAPMGADPLAAWPAFAESVRQRLEAGRAAYSDRSFSRDPAELVAEIQAELLDVAGWSFVLFQRLEAVRAALDALARLVGPEREAFLKIGALPYDLKGVPLSALPPEVRDALYPVGRPITSGAKNET